MSKSSVYWGTFLITIGGLFLLRSLSLLDADLSIFIQLWPVFLILWGLSIIKFPDIVKNILAALSAILLALFIFTIFTQGWSFTKNNIFKWKKHMDKDNIERVENYSKEKILYFDSTVTSAELNVHFGAGVLELGSTDENSIRINGSYFELDEDIMIGNTNRVVLSVSSPGDDVIMDRIKGEYSLEAWLSKGIEWYIDVSIGAADIDLDLSALNTPKVNIDCGACDMDLKLGTTALKQEISIDCGASDIKIKIPDEFGCRILADTFLSDEDFEGFEKKGDYWETVNIHKAEKIIDINLDGGVSSFKVVKY